MKKLWNKLAFYQQVAIVVTAFVVSFYISLITSYESEKNLQKTRKLVNAITNKTRTILINFDELINKQQANNKFWNTTNLQETSLLSQDNIYVQYYKNDVLEFANTQLALPDANKYYTINNNTVIPASTANTNFICCKKCIDTDSRQYLWIFIPIQDHYLVNNPILKNVNYFKWNFSNTTTIDTVQFANSIPLVINKKPIYFIGATEDNLNYIENYKKDILFLVSILLPIWCIYLLFLVVKKRYGKYIALDVYVTSLVFFKIFATVINYPKFVYADDFTNGQLDSIQYFLSTSSDFIFDFLIILSLVTVLVLKIRPIQISTKGLLPKYLISIFCTFCFLFFEHKLFSLLQQVIELSNIDFEVSIIDNLNIPSLLVFFLIAIGISFAVESIKFYLEINEVLFGKNLQHIWLTSLIALALMYYVIVSTYNEVSLTQIYFLGWSLITVFFLRFKILTIKYQPFSFITLLWIVFMAFSITLFIAIISEEKNKISLLENAKEYITDRDIILETKIDNIVSNNIIHPKKSQQQLAEDLITSKLMLLNSSYNFNYIDSNIIFYDSLFTAGEISITDGHLSYQATNFDDVKYILKVPSSTTSYAYILCRHLSPNNFGLHPDFLYFDNVKSANIAKNIQYQISVFINKQLKYNSHKIIPAIKDSTADLYFYTTNKKHYLQYTQGKSVAIISKNTFGIINLLVLFSFTFSWLFIIITFALLLYQLFSANFSYRQFVSNISLDFKLRFFIILVIIEFIIFLIFLLFINYYATKTISADINQNMEYSSKVLQLQLANQFADKNNYENTTINMQQLKQLQTNYDALYNLYDSTGKIIFASLPMIYQLELQNKVLAKNVLYDNINKTKHVKIGESYYKQRIDKFTNNKGLAYYLLIPNYQEKKYLQQSKLQFFAPMLDILIIILLVTGLISYWLAKYLSDKIKVLSDKIKLYNINVKDKFIDWHYDDEIKPLVQNYNIMVAKVEMAAKQLAETERDNAWREMAKQVAHEIKNPITPIRLTLQQLQRSIDNQSDNVEKLTKRAITTIINQIDSLNEIAINFSEFGQMPPNNPSHFLLNDLLKITVHLYTHNEENIYVKYIACATDVFVLLDKDQIKRIINNLIANAIQSIAVNETGLITVTHLVENDRTLIIVQDNGRGIPEQVQDKIFQPYFTTKNSGTGLGLAMSKDILEKNGGNIWFTTQEGIGTSFYIDLPIAD